MKEGNAVLAVQTLRNWLMSTTLLSTTAVMASIGLLGFVAQQSRNHALPSQPSTPLESRPHKNKNLIVLELTTSLDGWKIICLLISFMCAFFCFTQSLRIFNHVSILIPIISKHSSPSSPPLRHVSFDSQESSSLTSTSASSACHTPNAVFSSDLTSSSPPLLGPNELLPASYGTLASTAQVPCTFPHAFQSHPLLAPDIRSVGLRHKRSTTNSDGSSTTAGGGMYGSERCDEERQPSNSIRIEESGRLKLTPDFVGALFNRGAMFHTIGIRFFYLIFPIGAWFFSDLTMLITTAVLVVIMHHADSAELGEQTFELD
ncbi:hypothetical protein BC829DRAFT_54767 [Chytridium lagenaria]|nr:hypothetical protein BC829DRAFT_54767 [Chytridium lagenaria]